MPYRAALASALLVCFLGSFASGGPPAQVVITADTPPDRDLLFDSRAKVAAGASATVAKGQSARPSDHLRQTDTLARLRVQATLREAHELIEAGHFEQAAQRLEAELDNAEGSSRYLDTLALAYRGWYRQLLANRRPDDARRIADRLQVLDAAAPTRSATAAAEPAAAPTPGPAEPANDVASKGKPDIAETAGDLAKKLADSARRLVGGGREAESDNRIPIAASPTPAWEARGRIDEEADADGGTATSAAAALAQADEAFHAANYAAALPHYEKAYAIDPMAAQDGRQRWAYCLLYVCIDRYNELSQLEQRAHATQWQNLAADVRLVRELASGNTSLLKKTTETLEAIEGQLELYTTETAVRNAAGRQSASAPDVRLMNTGGAVADAPAQVVAATPQASADVPIQHLPGQHGKWSVLETPNFRVHHRNRQQAERIARLAEQARAYSFAKWFPNRPADTWAPKCAMYLYPSGQEYSQDTGVPARSPGHTDVLNERGRIVRRRLNLRLDDPNIERAVLPHEVTHIVLNGPFGAHTLPRWADEGIAVLTEPVDKQRDHLAGLVRYQNGGRGFRCAEVMTMAEYPNGRWAEFYAHSVGICRYLVDEHGGEKKLIRFLDRAMQLGNYDAALQEVYGLESFAALEAGFTDFVAGLGAASGGRDSVVAARGQGQVFRR